MSPSSGWNHPPLAAPRFTPHFTKQSLTDFTLQPRPPTVLQPGNWTLTLVTCSCCCIVHASVWETVWYCRSCQFWSTASVALAAVLIYWLKQEMKLYLWDVRTLGGDLDSQAKQPCSLYLALLCKATPWVSTSFDQRKPLPQPRRTVTETFNSTVSGFTPTLGKRTQTTQYLLWLMSLLCSSTVAEPPSAP